MSKFTLGQVVATPSALAEFEAAGEQPLAYLSRHIKGDWGDVDKEDAHANERAIADGTRIFSVYTLRNGTTVWIITEADRSSTTVLLPDDY